MQIEPREDLWIDIAPRLREQLGIDRYERWLAPLRVLSVSESEVRVGAPNTFWLEWIENRYLREVEAALSCRTGRAVRVTLCIDPELFRKMRRSQQEILAGTSKTREGEGPGKSLENNRLEALGNGSSSLKATAREMRRGERQQGELRQGERRQAAEPQTLENFVLGPSNRIAHTAALRVVENPGILFNPFFIHGGCGLGKTHLLRGICQALRNRCPDLKVRYLTGEDFLNHFVTSLRAKTTAHFRDRYRTPQVLAIDDIHLLGGKSRTQEEFLHTFNALTDAGHQIVLSSDSHPKQIGKLQDPLVGRFLSGLVVAVGRPGFETRLEILRRRAQQARAFFSEEVLCLVAEKVRSNIRELLGAFNFLEEVSLQQGRRLDSREAQAFLPESLLGKRRRIKLSQIAEKVGSHFGIGKDVLLSSSRRRSLTLARQVAMFLCRKYTDNSLAEIGKFFGDRNHTSVKSAEGRVECLRQSNPVLARDIEKIIDSFEE